MLEKIKKIILGKKVWWLLGVEPIIVIIVYGLWHFGFLLPSNGYYAGLGIVWYGFLVWVVMILALAIFKLIIYLKKK